MWYDPSHVRLVAPHRTCLAGHRLAGVDIHELASGSSRNVQAQVHRAVQAVMLPGAHDEGLLFGHEQGVDLLECV
jgi:hypothetical protein